MNDWSKLITVNFIGGFCGDFICSLIYNSYYDRDVSLDSDVTKAYFQSANKSLSSVIYDGKFFRNLDLLIHIYHNQDLFPSLIKNIEDVERQTGLFDKENDSIAKLYKICYDPDANTFVENVTSECRAMIPAGLEDYTVITHVTTDTRFPQLTMKEIFPSSKNFSIICTDKKYDKYFRLLGYYKHYGRLFSKDHLKHNYEAIKSLNGEMLETYEGVFMKDLGESKIFADKFLFDDHYKYIDDIEETFSSLMNKKLRFDRGLIRSYRQKNRQIIADCLGLDTNFDHKSKSSLLKINAYLDDVQGKNNVQSQ